MNSRLKQLFIKEFIELMRDPRMRAIAIVVPVIQIVILAQAFVLELKNVELGILDHDQSVLSRELTDKFVAAGHFNIRYRLNSDREIRQLLDAQKVRAIISIPAGFANKAKAGKKAELQLITDGTLANDAGLIQGYSTSILHQFLNENNKTGFEVKSRAWFNPNLESRFYYVPGLIGIMIVLISFMLASIAIVKEKEVGTIEQLMVTPISRYEFILGKTIPYLFVSCITVTIMLLVAFAAYGISVKGSWILLYAVTIIFICGNLGGALFISVISTTQQQALLTAFFFLLPSIMLSGLLFPIRNMPETVQYLTLLNPFRWYLNSLHGIVVKGAGFMELKTFIFAQLSLATLFISFAIMKFHKSSD
jgi:ABC-2 type transport system permease protein